MTRSFLLVERRGFTITTLNKALLALALGLALTACSNPQGDASAAETTYAANEAQPATDNAASGNVPAAAQAAADTAAISAATAAGTTTGGGNTAVQAQDLAKEEAASAEAKSNNIPEASISQTAVAADGKALYQATCVACHGPKGKGAIPGVPDLSKGAILAKPDAELTANILNGFQTKGSPMAMPPKGGNPNLTAADAKALVTYLRTLAKN